ncbi:hypothetical protein [Pseudonocardia nigra]|uniref:hypothetical protein n=1 Tax=Pseudonocardia nigra TaxID=1921578 RepID=UPI001C5D49A9|nr:hypothetical protein [Pseudonocardia nigra]
MLGSACGSGVAGDGAEEPSAVAELPVAPGSAAEPAAVIDHGYRAEHDDAVPERLTEWVAQ